MTIAFENYRKRPVVIQAVQWDGSLGSANEISDHIQEETGGKNTVKLAISGDRVLAFVIETLEGPHEVSPNDFIIRGIVGEYYACKPDIFASSYEKE